MTRLETRAYLAHLTADSQRFRDLLARTDPAARVPACPDWDAADLLWHLAEVQWSWSEVVAGRPGGPPTDHPPRPASYDGLLTALDEHSAALQAALAGADPAETAWTWSAEQTVGFTVRRQAHEALVHRVDAEQTAGLASVLDPALATDGVAELMEVMYGGSPPSWGTFTPTSGTVDLQLVDTATTVRVQPGEIGGTDPDSGRVLSGPHLLVVPAAGAAAATVRGGAAAVDLWLWHRRDATGVDRVGDADALAAFAAAVSPALD